MNDIIVYSKNNCVQCRQTKKMLDRTGTPYTEINIEENKKAYKLLQEQGYLSAPVIMVYKNKERVAEWSGFRPECLKGYLNR